MDELKKIVKNFVKKCKFVSLVKKVKRQKNRLITRLAVNIFNSFCILVTGRSRGGARWARSPLIFRPK